MSAPLVVVCAKETFVVSTADKVIGREVFLGGSFDFEKFELAVSILASVAGERPKHLIDVGANIGSILIPALSRGFVDSATAFEPHPDNLKLLRANIALNNLATRVTVLGVAVGDQSDEELRLAESKSNSGNHSIGKRGIPVVSVRLDDQQLPANDSLLWMDIEGYEGHALSGAAGLLASGVPVVCEYNPTFLRKAGGMDMFDAGLAGRNIYDLGQGGVQVSLGEIKERYLDSNGYTDILAMLPRSRNP